MLIYLEAFMVSAGFKVSELDFIYAKATQDRLSPFRWSRAISSSRSRRSKFLPAAMHWSLTCGRTEIKLIPVVVSGKRDEPRVPSPLL